MIEDTLVRIAVALEALTPAETKKPAPAKRTRKRTPAKPKISEEDVRAKVKEVLDSKGKAAAMAILADFDANRLGDVDVKDYPKLIAKADAVLAAEDDDDEFDI